MSNYNIQQNIQQNTQQNKQQKNLQSNESSSSESPSSESARSEISNNFLQKNPGSKPILSFRNVSYKEKNGNQLVDFNFDLYTGQNIVFFGPENCGKDLIMPLAIGKILPQQGEIIFLEHNVAQLNQKELYNIRKEFGYLLENYGLLNNLSVRDNIMLPLRYHLAKNFSKVDEKIETLMDFYDLDSVKNSRPNLLTHSEKLKTAFLRALIIEPKLIFFNSIESVQDPLKLVQFLDLVQVYMNAHDTAYLVITYHVEIYLEHVNHYCLLHNGVKVFEGSGDLNNFMDNKYLKHYMNRSLSGPLN